MCLSLLCISRSAVGQTRTMTENSPGSSPPTITRFTPARQYTVIVAGGSRPVSPRPDLAVRDGTGTRYPFTRSSANRGQWKRATVSPCRTHTHCSEYPDSRIVRACKSVKKKVRSTFCSPAGTACSAATPTTRASLIGHITAPASSTKNVSAAATVRTTAPTGTTCPSASRSTTAPD